VEDFNAWKPGGNPGGCHEKGEKTGGWIFVATPVKIIYRESTALSDSLLAFLRE
jgi:hypothetical protein